MKLPRHALLSLFLAATAAQAVEKVSPAPTAQKMWTPPMYFGDSDRTGAAPLKSAFGRSDWKSLKDGPVMKPELPWELSCIEAPSVLKRGDTLDLFHGGGYNNAPQQIGCATGKDGIHFQRLFIEKPLRPNGASGSWNSSESGHPGIFVDDDGEIYMFYQANNDNGRTWFLSQVKIGRDLSASGLLEVLLAKLGDRPRFKRSTNLLLLEKHLAELEPVTLVLILDDAQNYPAPALEELRLLLGTGGRRRSAMAMILLGDDYLLGSLRLSVQRALFTRISATARLVELPLEDIPGNLHEKPYADLYARLTAKSNTFTIPIGEFPRTDQSALQVDWVEIYAPMARRRPSAESTSKLERTIRQPLPPFPRIPFYV